MNEQTLRKRLNRMTVLVAAISAAVIVGGIWASSLLNEVMQDALNTQMESTADGYAVNIRRQIDGDFQILNTLASFLQFGEMDSESFMKGIITSKEYTTYDYMGYFTVSGEGTVLDADTGGESLRRIEEMDEQIQDAVRSAWAGEQAVSRIYHPSGSGENVFIYAVPVYSGEKVDGALIAGLGIEVFTEVLHDTALLNGQGYIHMISDNGLILIRAEDSVVRGKMETIYDYDYITVTEQKKIKAALEEEQSCASEFTYEDTTYQVFLEPLGINGWYLFYVQTAQSVNSSIYQLMTNTQSITVFILLVLLGLILLGYRQIYRSNHSLIQSAWYDPVTGACNLAKFGQDIKPIIEQTQEYTLMALNIRQFKFFNEIFGGRSGDELLRFMKEAVERHIRAGEYFCRSSDDLFYIFLRETDRTEIRRRLEEIMEEVSGYAISHNGNYHILLYSGGVIGTDVADEEPSVQKSMTHVKFALNTARQSLMNNIWFYDTRLHEDEILENYVESHMHLALEREEFQMYLQPKADPNTGRINGAEALVRWIPESGRMIYPGQFIPIFENNGFCATLDMYMAEKVCRQIREWMDRGIRPLPLSVNQTKLLFYETDYVDKMKALLEKYQIPASLITLEILEDLAMENVKELNKRIDELMALGFQISMDDFGSGYSSLNILASLKINELKIDREFLLRLKEPEGDYERQIAIMNKLVELTKELGIRTVAEGVETEENEKLVRKMGCDQCQGYYYSKPLSAEEFSKKYMSGG